MTDYQSFSVKIRQSTAADAEKLEKKLDQLWIAGIFTIAEMIRLDLMICDLPITGLEVTA